MNSLFNSMMGSTPMGNLVSQYHNFRKTFNGDPQKKIQEMLNNGQITQAQVDQARSLATQLQKYMK
jgi:hypothetical protein